MIGIALITLAPGRMGGSEGYARALTSALRRVGTEEYLVAVPRDAVDAAGGLAHESVGVSRHNGRLFSLIRAGIQARSLEFGTASVVHFPLTVPLPPVSVPRVITLHDVLHHDHPRFVSRGTRAFRALAYDLAARRSNLVIVPSNFVKERAEARIRLDPDLIRVVPHGVDHAVFRPGAEGPKPFLLYPARFWPHKNHDALFSAFARVRRDRTDLELVLTGGGARPRSLPPGVRSAGFVSEAELAALYRSAEAMVFPSLYEGFGVPILEAMASGCPVAASDVAAIPEVAGGAAILFDPSNANDIAEGILGALANRSTLVERGLARARAFTWGASATDHELVYQELLR
jgi:glycosyltransferase involved in cell wall biosynthesis